MEGMEKTFLAVNLLLEKALPEYLASTNTPKETIHVKGYIWKEDVIHYRASIGDEGEIEPYTYVDTASGVEYCVDMTLDNFHRLMNGEELKEVEL
jgi:hypothetical protein